MTDDDIIQAAPHLVECDRMRAEHGTPCGCITRDVVAAVRPLIEAQTLNDACECQRLPAPSGASFVCPIHGAGTPEATDD